MNPAPLYDLSPALRLLLLGALLAALPLAALAWRRRADAQAGARAVTSGRHALTVLTLVLTFDLVLFGAFTRLTDSGLGCPDWPGCYGSASPLGAHDEIRAAQVSLPSGPVTHGKAWIEMTHRYLAMAVGALITLLMGLAWRDAWRERQRRRERPARGDVRTAGPLRESAAAASPLTASVSPWWAAATFLAVCAQGAFGALTVTMKLYPAIVTGHLLGAMALLALLAAQRAAQAPVAWAPPAGVVPLAGAVTLLLVLQIALGGWVSTNYAVLACGDFPTCQGAWWPPMDFAHGFTVRRALGTGAGGEALPFAALTAIHVVHRIGALVLAVAVIALASRLRAGGDPAGRRWSLRLLAVLAWQLASGVSNVVLGWPLAAAVAHTAGAAALVVLMTTLLCRAVAPRAGAEPASATGPATVHAPIPSPGPAPDASPRSAARRSPARIAP